jgi:hypothetical protein
MSSDPPLGWLSKSQAAELIGRDKSFVRRAVIPRMPPGTRRRGRGRGTPWELLASAVVAAFVEHLCEELAGDPAVYGGSDSPWLERKRRAQALAAEDDLAERRGQIISVELFRRVVEGAFAPIRRFATEQITRHGSEVEAAWTEAVSEFTREIERVIKPTDNGREAVSAETPKPADSVFDAAACGAE